MPWESWIAYVVTVLLLMSTPGPSHLLMLSNSMAHGYGRALATAAGDLSANVLQMLAAGLGVAALVLASEHAFAVIKWLGVAYLVYLGVRMIARGGRAGVGRADGGPVPLARLWTQGFVTSAANPKAVVFFAALFPQFIDPNLAFWPQFLILSATYVVIDFSFLSAYGVGAGWFARRLKDGSQAWVARLGGGSIIGAAVLLGFKGVSR